MIDWRIKTIITILLCLSIATAQSPSAIKSKDNNKLEFQTMLKKWREKLKQFNSPEIRKSQEYVKLRQEMRKELQNIRFGKTNVNTPIPIEKKTKVTDVIQPFEIQNKHITQIDTLQQHKPSLPTVLLKVINATTCYDVPFASMGNTIELSIANTSTLSAEGVKIEATSIPEGIKFTEKTVALPTLKSKDEQTASFTFSIEKTAKVNKEDTLHFTITDKTGQKWTKEIKISITPPTTYELLQNYPNPFNPSTTIEYQLPGTGTRFNVSLKIYDVIGREVANLLNEQQEPGYYQKTFYASRYASGMYIYRLVATDEQNKHHVFQKKMLMLK
jgi:hypothetical protein